MYFYLHESHSRFTRVIEDNNPDLQEEVSKTSPKHNNHELYAKKYAQLHNIKVLLYDFDKRSYCLYHIASKYQTQAEDILLSNCLPPDMTKIHGYVTELLKLHIYLLSNKPLGLNLNWEQAKLHFLQFKFKMLRFTQLNANALGKLVLNLVSKQPETYINHYFHLMLDVMWLFVDICQYTKETNENQSLTELMQELHFIMYKCYEKSNTFLEICKCIRVLWLQIQLYCEKHDYSFWEMFNNSMNCYDEGYALFALKFLAYLQCYSEDGEFIGSTCTRVQENVDYFIKCWNLLIKNMNESKFLKILFHVESIIADLWLPYAKLDFFYVTWDYYYKKLEEITDKRQFNQILNELDSDMFGFCNSSGGSSKEIWKSFTGMDGYLLFVKMLKNHLKRHPNHWNKFKGRIYTKFPPTKFQKLNVQGLQNLALLFFEVSFVNFDEVTKKFLDLLKSLPSCTQNTSCTWNIYIHMMKQHLHHQKSLTEVYNVFGPLLEETSCNRTLFHLFTILVNNLPSFFRVEDLTLQQNLLIGSWLDNYIKHGALNEVISLLNTLSMIIETTVDSGVWYIYQPVFITHILHPVRRLTINQAIVGTVAGLIIANSDGLDEIIEQFISDTIPGEVMMTFFMTLKRKSLYLNNEHRDFLIIKAWFLSWLIGVNNVSFTKEIVDTLRLEQDVESGNNQDPFELFLQTVSKSKLQACLKNSERFLWKNLNLHVYTNMALVFHNCGSLLYTRSASSCPLTTFFNKFLLPMEVLRGSKPNFLPMVEKTWHLFMFSMWKLNSVENDAYLERLIRDLTIRYLPHFNTKPTVLLKVLNNQALTEFMFKKISSEFFEYNPSKHIPDESLFKALSAITTILDEIICSSESGNISMVLVFGRIFLVPLYEVYMFKNHKVAVMEIVKKLAPLRLVNPEIQEVFVNALSIVLKKHLAFSTNQFFQIAFVLVKVIKDIVSRLLGRIKEEISILECKRGQGFDNHLRQSFDKLRKLC